MTSFGGVGQGPYYGQGVWFAFFHHEKLPSAVERYFKEAERVRSVLDLHLSRQAGEKQGAKVATKDVWLVGDKMTVADLSWFIWEQIIKFTMIRAGVPIEEVCIPSLILPSTIYIFILLSPFFW